MASLGWRSLTISVALQLGGILTLHNLCLAFYPKAELDLYGLSDFYPLSVFQFRLPTPSQVALGGIFIGLFVWLQPRLSRRDTRLSYLFLAGLAFALISNLLQGWQRGIVYPTATIGDAGFEYYHDAVKLEGARAFLERFNATQDRLFDHSRTHPPGPVLLYYALHLLLQDPGAISLAVCALSLALALPYLRRFLRQAFSEEPPGVLLLFCILPAILIYGLAVVDAVIAAVMLATVVEFLDARRPHTWLLSSAFLALSLFFTFGALVLLPVLVGFELLRRRSLTRSVRVIVTAGLLLASLRALGFDWLEAFVQASRLENERGFLLFADPRRYFWYRLGAIAEIAFFFTPFLVLLSFRGLGALRASSADFYALTLLALASLLALLLSGAMQVGEAARICMFILPYLLLPASSGWREMDEPSRRRILYAVFGWGLTQQLFGFYYW